MQTDPIYNAATLVTLADFFGRQCLHLFDNSSFGDTLGRISTLNQHPIIVTEESQRIAGNFASFGIKNARRTAGESKAAVFRPVDQAVPGTSPLVLLDDNVSSGDHFLQFACSLGIVGLCW